MAKGFALKKVSLFYIWFFSYLLILLVPISISSIVYIEARKIVEKEINRANAALLKQAQQAMDNRLIEVRALSRQIALTPNLQSLIYVDEDLESFHRYAIFRVIRQFRVYRAVNTFVDYFYVYLKSIDSVITADAYYSSSLLYEVIHQYDGMPYGDWQRLVRSQHSGHYLPLYRRFEDGKVSQTIAYATSLPIENVANSLGTIVILLDEKCFSEAVRNIKWLDRSVVFILNQENQILASTQPLELSGSLGFDRLGQHEGTVYGQLRGEVTALSYTRSNVADWKYVSATPVRIFMDKARYIRRLTLVSLFACLLLGGLIAFLFSRRNYYPVNMLVQSLAGKVRLPAWKGYNEYRFIREAISTTLDEKEKVDRKLRQQESLMRSNFLMRLLKGRLRGNIPIHELLSSLDIEFASDLFAVMLFHLEELQGSSEKLNWAQYILGHAVEQSLEQRHKSYTTEVDDMIASLVNLAASDQAGAAEELERAARGVQQTMKEKFRLDFTISISAVHSTLAGIPEAYQESLEAMEYKMVMGSGGILLFTDIKSPPPSYYYPLETEQQLINHIKAGDYRQAQQMLHEVFRSNFSITSIPIEMAKCLIFDLVSTMIKTINVISIPGEHSFWDELKPVRALLKCETAGELEEEMLAILKRVCDFINRNKKSHNVRLRDDIVRYIEDNYHDINLSITMIADFFHMNPSYLSRFFKEQKGEGLLEFINRVRLEKAKCLLKEETFNIAKVARKVGYFNCNTFIRIFKKYEGLTPGRYKEIQRAEETLSSR